MRAVITDLDGTVVDQEKRISGATVRAATDLMDRGISLIVATARTPAWVAGLPALTPSVEVAVCCGGAIGWWPTSGRFLWRDAIPPDCVDRIVRYTMRFAGAGIAAYDGQRWRATDVFAARGPTRRGPLDIVTPERIPDGPVCTMSVWHPGGVAERLRPLLVDVDPPLTVGSTEDQVADLAPSGTDKAAGVRRALAAVGVDPAQSIAFGDMPNDLAMFAVCARSVAVANAHPDVITAAMDIAPCVHDDGFARTLGELGLAGAYRADPARTGLECSCPSVESLRSVSH